MIEAVNLTLTVTILLLLLFVCWSLRNGNAPALWGVRWEHVWFVVAWGQLVGWDMSYTLTLITLTTYASYRRIAFSICTLMGLLCYVYWMIQRRQVPQERPHEAPH